ncbi:myb-binding protein 1A-like [Anopheles albimanus]|uniref:myb-binding protein 1A-like n=1 Tax=Anopheles albimanus TaxID=7167 RepID=UPI00163F35E3|nr:myb-binding protein 1A-like [Anopheles albimanus]
MKNQPGRKAGKSLDKTVFGFFENFSNPDDEVRIRGASALIEFLHTEGHTAKGPAGATHETTTTKTGETAYALKRLVRGVGSPTNVSKVGYYTALVGLLQQLQSAEDCPTVTELFKLVKSELADSDHDPAESIDAKERNRFEVRVGKVLVCGAIIKAGLIENATDLELQTVLNTLKSSMYKTLTKLVWTFLNDLVACISGSKFSQIFWPLFESLLNVPKEQHTMDTVYFLLLLLDGPHGGMVNKKYFLRNFDAPSLLHEKAFPYLGEILFGIESTMGINHPFINCLLEKLLKVDKVVAFWQEGVVPILVLPDDRRPKYRDIMFPHLILTWFGRLQDYSVVPKLLQPALITLLSEKLENVAMFSEDVRKLYQEACKAIIETYPKLGDESVRLATYRCLTQAPGSILIEKYASCKLLQNLLTTFSKDTLKTLAEELKAIILDRSTDNYLQRSYAAHMLQRLLSLRQLLPEPGTKDTDQWHLGMVRFFLILGIFYSADGKTVLKPTEQESAVKAGLAATAKAVFFHLLEHRHANMSEERHFLLSLVRCVHEAFKSLDGLKGLRNPLAEAHIDDWKRMYTLVTESLDAKKRFTVNANEEHKQRTVFHVLMMHMGLHLFNDAELAHSSITELESVMKRIDDKAKQRCKSTTKSESEEPEWIEVVVDLFLNLLSQNSLLLRKVISNVFPHLSGAMTLTAFNQILSVINLKDKTNPLAAQGDDENGQVEQHDDDEMGEVDDDDSEYNASSDGEEDKTGANNVKSEEDADEEEDDDDEIMGDEEEEETITDKMRQAVQAALGSANPESDAESLDLDDIDEEQGRRMDIALAEAFRSFRKNRKPGGKQKPTKAEQQMDTVLMHFRMRVFDLIDVYLKHEPDMMICLELMLYVFEMLPVAIREEAKYGPILNRYRQIFNMLIRIKQFRRNAAASDVDASQLNQILRDLIDKVAKGASFPERNQYLLKACQFIVICSQVLEKHSEGASSESNTYGDVLNSGGAIPSVDNDVLQVDKLFGKQLTEYLISRNPTISFNVFQNLFRMTWNGNWYLAITLTCTGLQVATIRAQRRIQALQLLRELLKNRRFINSELPKAVSSLRTICIALTKYMADLEEAVSRSKNGERTISQNELYELLQVLLEMHNLLNNLQQQQDDKEGKKQPMLRWDRIGAQVQALRRFNLNSQTMSCYRQLCHRLKLTPIGNGDIHTNGTPEQQIKKGKKSKKSIDQDDHDEDQEPINGKGELKEKSGQEIQRKRKQQDVVESKKEKRRKKEERLLIASQGMEAISFVNGT